MPTISLATTVAANTVSANVFAGSSFEFVAVRSIINLACTQAGAAASDITASFQIGGEAITQGANVSDRAAHPTLKDDILAMAGAEGTERLFLTYTNTTAGALLVNTLLEITPI